MVGTRLLEASLNSTKRFLIHCGGARAGKTVAIAQYLITKAHEKKRVITVVRKTLPAARATVWRDIQWVLDEQLGIWDDEAFNASEFVYRFPNGSMIEVISVDQPQKIRGRKRDILHINEANEITVEDFRQLNMRTTEKVICDYNPSDAASWIYSLEDDRADEVDFIRSTYLDNPFLTEDIKREIESFREADPEFWKVFGMGLRGRAEGLVYTKWDTVDEFPTDCEWTACGIDFGYKSPSALVRVGLRGRQVFVQELLYASGLTSLEIAQSCVDLVRDGEVLYCDSAEPDKIEDLRRAGVNVAKAAKDREAGVGMVRSYALTVVEQSPNVVRELGLYREGKDRSGETVIIDRFNHSMDAMRYAIYTGLRKGSGAFDYTWASF